MAVEVSCHPRVAHWVSPPLLPRVGVALPERESTMESDQPT